MRINICWFGMELNFYLGPTTIDDEPAEYVQGCSLDGGTTASQPVGFCPSLQPEWEIPGSYHQFDE